MKLIDFNSLEFLFFTDITFNWVSAVAANIKKLFLEKTISIAIRNQFEIGVKL